MGRAQCPDCGTLIGLGSFSDPGTCPACGEPLLLTSEMRTLTEEQIAELRRVVAQSPPSSSDGAPG